MEREGTIHITLLEKETSSRPPVYSLAYAPYDRGGGALRTRRYYGKKKLIEFLTEIEVHREHIDQALNELRQAGRASIPRVRLSDERIAHYGLGETGILEAIRIYLSTASS